MDDGHERHHDDAGAQRRIAAGNLHIAVAAVEGADEIDAAKDLSERQIEHGFGALREVAKRAVEIATLGDLLNSPKAISNTAMSWARFAPDGNGSKRADSW